jgi:hypothetical protein
VTAAIASASTLTVPRRVEEPPTFLVADVRAFAADRGGKTPNPGAAGEARSWRRYAITLARVTAQA